MFNVEQFPYLRIIMDNDMSLKPYFVMQKKRISNRIWLLRKILKYLAYEFLL